TLMAVAGIAKLSPIETMVACTYQAVSGAGEAGIRALEDETEKIVAKEAIVPSAFPAQISMNVIPFIGSYTDNGYTDEEMKMQNEGRKILHLPKMKCTCTCVRVPVMRSHSISVTLMTRDILDLDTVRAAISDFPGVILADDLDGRDYPTPLDTSDQDMVYVGRIRKDLTDERGITLWCCGDQIRKGAASNAVQILLKLIKS
ncbi:MAG: aspartate-semialdehyde dehydrogenase, partial [Oscillospiraceae bacterium]|nr:aspartate-semialdehyde dehydrogenase [Oscillospiraceae bacterium]